MKKILSFELVATIIGQSEEKVGKELYQSIASNGSKSLKKLLPKINDENKIIMQPVSFDGFVANKINNNNHGISGSVAAKITKFFIHTPINIEHDRGRINGFITSYSFSDHETGEEITEEQASQYGKKPFNVAFGGIIWKHVKGGESLSEILISDAKENKELKDRKIGASWELAFEDARYSLYENGKKDYENIEIFGSDSDEYKEIDKSVFVNKNNVISGKYKGKNIAIDVFGGIYPLGFGLTGSPAASVMGIETSNGSEEAESEEMESEEIESEEIESEGMESEDNELENDEPNNKSKNAESDDVGEEEEEEEEGEDGKVVSGSGAKDNIALLQSGEYLISKKEFERVSKLIDENNKPKKKSTVFLALANNVYVNNGGNQKQKISPNEQNNVIENKSKKNMIIKTIKDLNDENIKELQASDFQALLQSELAAASEKFSKDLSDKENFIESQKTENARLADEHTKLIASHDALQKDFDLIKQQLKDREDQEKFNARMEYLNQEYNLDDDIRQVIASDIKGMDDQAFESYKQKSAVVFKGIKKEIAASSDAKDLKEDNKEEVSPLDAMRKLLSGSVDDKKEVTASENLNKKEDVDQKIRDAFALNTNNFKIRF